MRKPTLRPLIALLLACFLLQPVLPARAAGPSPSCSLTLTYSKEDQVFPNCEIEIFLVADRLEDGSYEFVRPFSGYPVRINGISSQAEWQTTANTLEAYAAADWLAPTRADKTDENGMVTFQNLKPGLYLLRSIVAENDAGVGRFQSSMILLPMPQSSGSPVYDLAARPKGTFDPNPEEPDLPIEPDEKPESTEYRVVKLWNDLGYAHQRPGAVSVEIRRNGELYKTVQLNAGNNWTYTWEAPKNGDTWSALERDVPAGYTVAIAFDGYTFSVANSRPVPGNPPAPGNPPPQTGDSFPFSFLITVASLSGIGLLALGILYQRKYK